MSWDTAFERGAGEEKAKTEFTKFPEGITRIRIVDDAPYARWTHWFPQHKRSFNCTGYDCPICAVRKAQKAAGETPKIAVAQRFAINVLNRETGNVEIMEQGKQFFEELRDFNKDEGDLRTYDLKVKRKGSTKDDTSYRVDKHDVYSLTPEELDLIKEKRTDLKEYFKPHTVEQGKRLIAGEAWAEVMKGDAEATAPTSESDEDVEIS
jgi:hypothetical protein